MLSGRRNGVKTRGQRSPVERVLCGRSHLRTAYSVYSVGVLLVERVPVGRHLWAAAERSRSSRVPNALLGRKYTAAHFDAYGPAMAGRVFGRLDVAERVGGRPRASGGAWCCWVLRGRCAGVPNCGPQCWW